MRFNDTAKHKNNTPNACAMPQDEHTCNQASGHEGPHACACGEAWTQGEGDNAVLLPGAGGTDTKKKPERVRGFLI